MSKRFTTKLLGAAVSAVVLAVVLGIAAGSSAGSSSTAAAKQKVYTIAMSDPGCHWFAVGGKLKKNLTVDGATTFLNRDEAAVIFKGKGFLRRVAVGKTLAVSKPGTYRITMVGQHPDDNTLVLVVK